MKSMIARLFFPAALVLVLAGCAAPATRQGMTVGNLTLQNTQPFSVTVVTNGGEETEGIDSTNISNADLKEALENSITQTGLFKDIVQGEGGQYRLSVSITQIRKSTLEGNYIVDMETAWSLVKTSDRSIALRKIVISSYTSSTSESGGGTTRLRLAVEGAAKNNIAQGLRAISNLELVPRKIVPATAEKFAGLTRNQQATYQQFLTKPFPRAFAISKNGGTGFAWGNVTDTKSQSSDPALRALDTCKKYAGQDCQLYMIDDRIVYRE